MVTPDPLLFLIYELLGTSSCVKKIINFQLLAFGTHGAIYSSATELLDAVTEVIDRELVGLFES